VFDLTVEQFRGIVRRAADSSAKNPCNSAVVRPENLGAPLRRTANDLWGFSSGVTIWTLRKPIDEMPSANWPVSR